MSHAPPTNDPLLLERAYIEGWVLALTFGAEEEFRAGHIITGLLVMAMSILGQIVVIKWPAIKTRIAARSPNFTEKFSILVGDPRWWVITLAFFLLFLSTSRFVEERQWPFSAWFHPNREVIVVEKQPDAQAIEKATAPLKQQVEQLQTALQETQRQRDQALSRQPSQAATPTQPPLSGLSPEDIATQIGIWTLVDDRMNDLAKLLNRGYGQLDKWEENTKTDRNNEIANFNTLNGDFETFRRQLADFRDLYLNDPQIASVLAPVVIPGGRTSPSATIFLALRASIEQFMGQLANLKDGLTDAELERQMIPYVGALKRDLNAMRTWQGQVRNASVDQQKQLSKSEAR